VKRIQKIENPSELLTMFDRQTRRPAQTRKYGVAIFAVFADCEIAQTPVAASPLPIRTPVGQRLLATATLLLGATCSGNGIAHLVSAARKPA
jgi:hypothetical protein